MDPEAADHSERRAQTWIIVAMLLVAAYIVQEAVRALLNGSHAESSALGLSIGVVSLAVLPPLGVLKLQVASRLDSQALRGDGVLTVAAAALAVITLVSLVLNSVLGWWWADPVAALLIAAALAAEGVRVAVRHRFG